MAGSITLTVPWLLSDHNAFLKGFVNHEFLSFMGVVVTITLASAANLFIELNKLEDRLDTDAFTRTKGDVRSSAFCLVGALAAAILLVVLKPLVAVNEHIESVANSVALGIILFSVLILVDLTQAAFNLDLRGK